LKRHTVIVEGPLAYQTRRWRAAREGDCGLQILTLAQLAARLGGGFFRPALAPDLEPLIQAALDAGGFSEIGSLCHLPGMTSASARTLTDLWAADVSLSSLATVNPRIVDLALMERRVSTALPSGVLLPRELRDLALKRLAHAPAVLGSVELDHHNQVPEVWRPLLIALHDCIELRWTEPVEADTRWFPGTITRAQHQEECSPPEVVSCADPHAEVIEALRWARELIASGKARPEEIAICATSTAPFDEHFVTLVDSAQLPVHFSAGRPALSSWAGQTCAALADLLQQGLSQDRVRRLVRYSAGHSEALAQLPADWARGLQAGAALFELDQWRRALAEAHAKDFARLDPSPMLLPVLERLAQGVPVAHEAGAALLDAAARTLWRRALSAAPAQALEFSLQTLKVTDSTDPCSCAVWCPANHLVSAPRPYVRLLGVNSGQWPRKTAEDPLLPSHLLERPTSVQDSVTQNDRRAFHRIVALASGACVASLSRRDRQGRPLARSPLLKSVAVRALTRGRIPEHAFSTSDRFMARPKEAIRVPGIAGALACSRSWSMRQVTAHDGRISANHLLIQGAIARVQSATSLRLLLTDPLAFVWRYALDWYPSVDEVEPLELDARTFGELVHELLNRAVRGLEPRPGYALATPDQLSSALHEAVEGVRLQWPLDRSIPPKLLWEHTLVKAHELAYRALSFEQAVNANTRCWTEVPFGELDAPGEWPWDSGAAVLIPGTEIRIRGSIDRLDLRWDGQAVRVSDYKTGREPSNAEQLILGGGTELQRVVYAIAARALLPQVPKLAARLVFLGGDHAHAYPLKDIDAAMKVVSTELSSACTLLLDGKAVPHTRNREEDTEFRLALPADVESYIETKRPAFRDAFGDLTKFWKSP
jgi:PD-(D/E)XK nuclease superfamily